MIMDIVLAGGFAALAIIVAIQRSKLRNLEERTEDTFSRVQGIINKERAEK